jgi:small basic protein (TIGR04137 family)
MSLDRSLKTAGGLIKHRNVLTRAERVAKLAEAGKFDLSKDDPVGIPKVLNRRIAAGGKKKVKKEAAEEPAKGKKK